MATRGNTMESNGEDDQFIGWEADTGENADTGDTGQEAGNEEVMRWFGGDDPGMSTIEYCEYEAGANLRSCGPVGC
ncbi:MAG: hypothetical protein L0J70_11620, partial [Corynebacterium sp.]|nr:hypothetical protein [Corynebacterium sp.]